jgi:YjbE family integral membrane protein
MDLHLFAAAGGIVLADIVLSGDNALVIGAVASKLPRAKRFMAILYGGLGAIVLRLLLSVVATELLQVPLLRLIGGVTLLWITLRLLMPDDELSSTQRQASEQFLPAMLTILAADATMSLDNVFAVAALANGHIPLLVGGLIFSMTLLFIASSVVAGLIERATWLLDVAAIVLGLTAANLILDDKVFKSYIALTDSQQMVARLGMVALVLVIDLILHMRRRRATTQTSRPAADSNGHHTALPSGPLRTLATTSQNEPTAPRERAPGDVS